MVPRRSYASIQEALDANPGRMIHVPSGDHEITTKILIKADRSGLYGSGRIIQKNAGQPILAVEQAEGVRLRDPHPHPRPRGHGDRVGGLSPRSAAATSWSRTCGSSTIAPEPPGSRLRRCVASQVHRCLVQDYQRVSVDDRTANPENSAMRSSV